MSTPTLSSSRAAIALSALVLVSCGRPAEDVPMKHAGVGLNPDEIGPLPEERGGLIEVDHIDFSGAGLPLGLVGLVSYDSVGPEMIDFAPPYAMISTLGFIFETDAPAPDTLFGNFGTAPSGDGNCYTNFNPRSYLSNIVDVGDSLRLSAEGVDADGQPIDYVTEVGRRPAVFGPVVNRYFPYYFDIQPHRTQPQVYNELVDPSAGLAGFEEQVLRHANFGFGLEHTLAFDGGIPPYEATWASIPVPLATNGQDNTVTYPTQPLGVRLSWDGPTYDGDGNILADSTNEDEVNSTCMQFLAHTDTPASSEDCVELEPPPNDGTYFEGQVYTGPWDTTDGLTFEWIPSLEGVDETVTIGVRFLGPVEEDDEYKVDARVQVAPSPHIEEEWNFFRSRGFVPEDMDVPDGMRPALACDDEDDIEWVFDPNLRRSNGDYVLSLQGEPSSKLAEVVCRANDGDGSFQLTEHMLESAITYALANDAQGAIFYLNRTTTTDIDVPPVRDRYGQKRDTSDVRVVVNAVQIGRFWFDL